jgi:hypothetical protein
VKSNTNMSNPGHDNASNLSRTLQQSLQEVLMEVSFDNNRNLGAPFSVANTFNPLHQNLNRNRYSSFTSAPSIATTNSSSALHAALGNAFTSSGMAFGAFGGGGSTGASSTSTGSAGAMRPSEVLGMSTEELLFAAATEKRMLEATQRAAVVRQQSLAERTLESRRLYNESVLALMKGCGTSAPPTSTGHHASFSNNNTGLVGLMRGATNSGLFQQGILNQLSNKQPPQAHQVQVAHQSLTAAKVPALADSETKTAIKVLGTSLRKKDSPYLDVSRLHDPDVSDKRTRGGVTEPFPEKLHRYVEVELYFS